MKNILIVCLLFVFSLPVYANGIGVQVYKAKSLKMPLYITNVELRSPAERASIKKASFITKINKQSTIKMSLEECLTSLNSDDTDIVLELKNAGGRKSYKVKINKNAKFNDIKGDISLSGKDFLKSPVYQEIMHYNNLKDIVSVYLYEFDDNSEAWKAFNRDFSMINEMYNKYQIFKNNMKENYELVALANQLANIYTNIINNRKDDLYQIIKDYNKVHEYDLKTLFFTPLKDNFTNTISYDFNSAESQRTKLGTNKHPITVNELYTYHIKPLNVPNIQNFVKLVDTLSLYSNKCRGIASEVSTYSRQYEQQKLTKIKQSKGFMPDGNVMSVVLGYKTPIKNAIYYYNAQPVSVLEALQNVNGGLLITPRYDATYYSYASSPKTIIVLTSRRVADNELLRHNMYLLYQGLYTYNNVLGAKNTIYKFKEISKSEYDKYSKINLNGFYFINYYD